MRFSKTQLQDIEKSVFKEPEAKRTPWWYWLIGGMAFLILASFLVAAFLAGSRKKLKDRFSLPTPTPVSRTTPAPTEASVSAETNLQEELIRARVFFNEIDLQQEELQPPLIDLDLGL